MPTYGKLSNVLAKEWTMPLLFNAALFTFFLILSFLSTSVVVYIIACVYTGWEVTFQKVLSVVPRVWRRLMVMFMLILLAVGVLYLVGLVNMSIIWQLASVVSVLKEEYGFRAMAKSNDLIKGKIGLLIVTFLMLTFLLGFVQVLFKKLVVHGDSFGILAKVGFGIICLTLLSGLFLFGLTIQTVVYFVCKSYHHENIDKSALSDHLEVYLGGESVLLRAKDVQLE
ncbi:hypothetical protein CDL15_Pgr028311 [Punica granatum]|uniref:Uncharacterized protein n=1 Tax=Punica granatum TaxID=22663 RepID=A0A218W4Q9_PUNGR|nr:hypothetical protein CDL15_Pgr028311 [Punica granatum]